MWHATREQRKDGGIYDYLGSTFAGTPETPVI